MDETKLFFSFVKGDCILHQNGDLIPILPKGNDKMLIGSFKDMINYAETGHILPIHWENPKEYKLNQIWVHMFKSGYRITKDNVNWKDWSGCTFTDIDAKFYFKSEAFKNEYINYYHKEPTNEDIEKLAADLLDDIIECVNSNINKYLNFYFIQLTPSGLGYRILWYWNVPKNNDNFNKCAYLTQIYTVSLFTQACSTPYSKYKLNVDTLINYKGPDENGTVKYVLDPCSFIFAQGMYFCKNKVHLSPLINPDNFQIDKNIFISKNFGLNEYGNTDFLDFEIPEQNKSTNKENKSLLYATQSLPYATNIQDFDIKCPAFLRTSFKHKNRKTRWFIYDALIYLFNDISTVNNEWNKIMTATPIGSHNLSHYIYEPIAGGWYNEFISLQNDKSQIDKLNNWIQIGLTYLKEYGYDLVKKPNTPYDEITEFIPDETIQLKPNEYISDFSELIKSKLKYFSPVHEYENVYIKADCGTGKSYFFREIFNCTNKCVIVTSLNSIKNSVYEEEFLQNNVQFTLIKNLTQISDLIKNNKVPDKMIISWPQLIKLYEDPTKDVLKDHLKLFDEIHNFVTAFSYRGLDIWKIVKNKSLHKNCILVSATPCGEHNFFCNNSLYKFEFQKTPKYKQNIYLVQPTEKQINEIEIYNDVNKKHKKRLYITDTLTNFIIKNKYQVFNNDNIKIGIFDNYKHVQFDEQLNSNNPSENLVTTNNLLDLNNLFDITTLTKTEQEEKQLALHWCKDKKDEKENKNLAETKILKQPVFLSTTYGVEGIEIKNEIDELNLFIPFYEDEITFIEIEQVKNRFRNVNKTVNIFFFLNPLLKPNEETVEEKRIQDENFFKFIKENTNADFMMKYQYHLSNWQYVSNIYIQAEKLQNNDDFYKLVFAHNNFKSIYKMNRFNIQAYFKEILKNKFINFIEDSKTSSKNPVHLLLGKNDNIKYAIGNCQKKYCVQDLIKLSETDPSFDNNIKFKDWKELQKIRLFTSNILLHIANFKKNDFFTNNEIEIQETDECKFLTEFMKLFINQYNFSFSTFKRFIRARSMFNSNFIELLNSKQLEYFKKETNFYSDFIQKYELQDDFTKNLYQNYKNQINKIQNKSNKRCKKGDRKGKALNKYYQLIDDNTIQFNTKKECYNYLKLHKKITCTFDYFNKRKWTKFFQRLKNG